MNDDELQDLYESYRKAQIGEPGKAFWKQIVEQGGGLAELAGHYANSQTLQDMSDSIYNYADSLKPQGRELTDAEKAADFVASYGPATAIGLATKNPNLALGFDALQETGNTIHNLRREGASGERLNQLANETLVTNGLAGLAARGAIGIAGNKLNLSRLNPLTRPIRESKNKVASYFATPAQYIDDGFQNAANEQALRKYRENN